MDMIIGVDVDGVLADFNHAFIELCKRVTGRDLFLLDYEPLCWDYPEAVGYTKDEVTKCWDAVKANRTFWSDLPVYETTHASIRYLQMCRKNDDDVYFITNRIGDNPKWQTEVWLRNLGFGYATVLLSAAKGLCAQALKLDVYIDDKWENCTDVAYTPVFNELKGQWEPKPSTTKVFLMSRPWNVGVFDPLVFRTNTVVGIAG